MFSGVTVLLYPLSTIKTKQMLLPGLSGGLEGARTAAAMVWRSEGILGFYRWATGSCSG